MIARAPWIFAALVVAALPAYGAYMLWQWRRHRGFGALARAMSANGDASLFHFQTPEGRVTVEVDAAFQGSDHVLEIRLGRSRGGVPALLRRETGLDRIGKALAINVEPEVGDGAFDRAIYIESDVSHDVFRSLFRKASVRRAVWELFARSFHEVSIHGSSLVAARAYGGSSRAPDERALRAIVGALSRLAEAVTQQPWPGRGSEDRKERGRREDSDDSLMGSYICTGIVLVALAYFAIDVVPVAQARFQPTGTRIYYAAFLLAFSIVALTAGYAFDGLRGSSTSLRGFIIGVVLLSVALPGWCVAGVLTFNAVLDGEPSRQVPLRIEGHGTTPGKNAHPYVELVGLRDEPLHFELNAPLPARLGRGDVVSVEIGAGALGWEWIRGVAPLAPPPAPPPPPKPSASAAPAVRPASTPRRRPSSVPARPTSRAPSPSKPAAP